MVNLCCILKYPSPKYKKMNKYSLFTLPKIEITRIEYIKIMNKVNRN